MFKKSLFSTAPSAVGALIGWVLIGFLFGAQTAIDSIFMALSIVFLNFALAYILFTANEFWREKNIEEEEKNTY